ncbi:MAG TPA: SRPBCC family protein [Allocoleopsis sp.]
MSNPQIFEQSILINTSATIVERCITDRDLMHKWLNPLLRCESVGEWNTKLGSKMRFMINIPLIKPTLKTEIIQREPGLIVWGFEGFFQGSDRWECLPNSEGTLLINRFEFTIPNPLVTFGFNLFAAKFTQKDMIAQLRRLKRVAELINSNQ